jgi:hypothetical protein
MPFLKGKVMRKTIEAYYYLWRCVCRAVIWISSRLRPVLLVTVAGFAFHANAASIPSPIVHVMIASAMDSESVSFLASAGKSPYTFSASVERFGGVEGAKGDIYLGVILPQQKGVLTWHTMAGAPVISAGYNPLVSDIDLTETSIFTVPSVLNSQIEFSFTGQEPAGLYLVFALLVRSGENPSDAQNWLGINIAPLVVQ